jgi:hypothetical protein
MKRILLTASFLLVYSGFSLAQLTGTYDIAGGANHYATLSAAFAAINTNGVTGKVTLRLMASFTDPGTTSLTRADMTSTNRVVIRPGASSIVVTMSSTLTIDGAEYVTIDGSQTEGGTTRDLSIEIATGGSGTTVIQIQGITESDSVRNCDVGYSGSIPDHAILVSNGSGKVNTVIDNVRMGGMGNYSSVNAAGILGLNNIQGSTVVTKCVIEGRAAASNDAFGVYIGTTSGSVRFTKNRLTTLISSTNGEFSGFKESFTSTADLDIFNNFIGGNFSIQSNTPSVCHLIEIGGTGSSRIYHNTVVLNSLSSAPSDAACVVLFPDGFSGATVDQRNNILVNAFDNSSAYCIYLDPLFISPSDVTSDDNVLYIAPPATFARTGFDGSNPYTTLTNWQSAFSPNFPDLNSVNTTVNLVSATDLHLANGAGGNGDVNLRGTDALVGVVADDIDGEPRQTGVDGPYMGADEGSSTLPVQLVNLSVSANRLDASLRWSTATETNNHGFEIERRNSVEAGVWAKVGFVPGSGTSSSPREYSYIDNGLAPGRYAYRIKQVDNDGTFTYYSAAEVEVGLTAKVFALESNYPNPFNPSTNIAFSIPQDGKVSLKVFNILGQEVAVLFDGFAEAGKLYQRTFDASALPTGLYFSRLESADGSLMRKMMLVK